MTNHLHLVAGAKNDSNLSDILRDFKKFTSKAFINTMKEMPESRRDWMLNRFWYAGKNNKKIKYYKVWQDGNEAKEIQSADFLDEKMNYIHFNPVRAELVAKPEDYLYCSARDYSGEKGLVETSFVYIFCWITDPFLNDADYKSASVRINGVQISTPNKPLKRDSVYAKRVKRKKFRRRAACEPVIGHMKKYFRMEQNYLHDDKSCKINALLAAAGWNFKKMMEKLKADFKNLIFWFIENLQLSLLPKLKLT